MSAVVETRDVVKDYGGGGLTVRALKGVSISVDPGEFLSVMGPSGSGKSTLLHLIGCLDNPTAGRVLVEGTDTAGLSDDELTQFRRLRVGFIFQFFNLLPAMSAWENVAVPRLLEGIPLRRTRPEACELLARVGLDHRVDHRPAELSGGELQRVAIARALMNKPVLIVADEPTGNLDSATGDEVLALLRECASGTSAVVMVTHSAKAASIADRVVELEDGEITADDWRMSRTVAR